MTTTTRTRLRAHQVPTPPLVAAHRRDVARWALANGHPVERDALAVLVALRTEPSSGTVDTCWTTGAVDATLRDGAPAWCRLHDLPLPRELAPTLATYLRYLAANRQLGRRSDTAVQLRRAVADRDDASGARARHPAAGRRAPVVPIA